MGNTVEVFLYQLWLATIPSHLSNLSLFIFIFSLLFFSPCCLNKMPMRCTLACDAGPQLLYIILYFALIFFSFPDCKFCVCGCGSSGSCSFLGREASLVQKLVLGLCHFQVLLIKVKISVSYCGKKDQE